MFKHKSQSRFLAHNNLFRRTLVIVVTSTLALLFLISTVVGITRALDIVDDDCGWRDNNQYYYEHVGNTCVAKKGLHNIDSKWYLFDRETGLKQQEGYVIYFGSFYTSNNGQETPTDYSRPQVMPAMYISLNGLDMTPIDTLWDTNLSSSNTDYYSIVCGKISSVSNSNCKNEANSGFKSIYSDGNTSVPSYLYGLYRDPAPLIRDGRLFLAGTSASAANASDTRDLAILGTNDLFSYSWGHPSASIRSTANDVWAPRWFTDYAGNTWTLYAALPSDPTAETTLYVTPVDLPSSTNKISDFDGDSSHTANGKAHAVFSNANDQSPAPLQLNYENNSQFANDIDAKNAMKRIVGGDIFYDTQTNQYYLFAQREHCEKGAGICTNKTVPSAIVVFELDSNEPGFTSWNYLYQIDNASLDPDSKDPATTNGVYPYSLEGASIISIDNVYYLYSDTYSDTDGYKGVRVYQTQDGAGIRDNAWKLAAKTVDSDTILYGNDSLSNAQKGSIDNNNTKEVYLRRGAWTKVTDEKFLNTLKVATSGKVAIPTAPEPYHYDGEQKFFTDNYERIYNNKLIGMQGVEQIGGIATATNQGEYEIQVRPKTGLTWEDGTTDTKSITWKIIDPQTYTVHFDANTGTGTMDDQLFEFNQEQALTKNTFTKQGYRFTGWTDSQDGTTGNHYTDEQQVSNLASTNGATVTLYAQWAPEASSTFTVTFTDGQGTTGSHVLKTETVTEGGAATAPANPSRTGYEFKGW
ncbi:InlB B-repeat-containing protein, partial [Candidatus Saccharibacteria bacterium]|nr:InlB B-repeat-containing protein [Candidatus Saccharibacteria bacterium]